MTCPALARPSWNSIVLFCTSIPETCPKSNTTAGQSTSGPWAEAGTAWLCSCTPGTEPWALQWAAQRRVAAMLFWEGAAPSPGDLPGGTAEVSRGAEPVFVPCSVSLPFSSSTAAFSTSSISSWLLAAISSLVTARNDESWARAPRPPEMRACAEDESPAWVLSLGSCPGCRHPPTLFSLLPSVLAHSCCLSWWLSCAPQSPVMAQAWYPWNFLPSLLFPLPSCVLALPPG